LPNETSKAPDVVAQENEQTAAESQVNSADVAQAEAKHAWVTNALIIANIAVFTWMVLSTGAATLIMPSSETLRAWGANFGPRTLSGEWWRVFTAGFVHMGLLHVFMNMWVLYDVGRAVEELYGSSKFFAIYMIALVGGCICSLLVNPMLIGAGASGAVFGSFGALIAFWWRHHNIFPAGFIKQRSQVVVFLLACTLIYGFYTPEIDNAAHLGGLIFGFLGGLLLMPRAMNAHGWSIRDGISLSCLSVAFLLIGWVDRTYLFSLNNNVLAFNLSSSGGELLKQRKYEEALRKFDELVRRMPELAPAYGSRAAALASLDRFDLALKDCNRCIFLAPHESSGYILRAGIYHKLGKEEQALTDLNTAVRNSPRKADPYNNRAWTKIVLRNYSDAIADASRAIRLEPTMAAAYDTRGLANYYLGKYDEAASDYALAIKFRPNDAAPYYHRALLDLKRGDTELAKSDQQKAKELDYQPDDWELSR
jgi:rhomboid protease GluP